MQRCPRVFGTNGVFGVKVGLPLRRRRRSEEGTTQKSSFQLHVCDGRPSIGVPQADPTGNPLYLYRNVHGTTFTLEVLGEVDGEETGEADRDSHRVAWKIIK